MFDTVQVGEHTLLGNILLQRILILDTLIHITFPFLINIVFCKSFYKHS